MTKLTEHPAFDPPGDAWVNYGDVNPDRHGGRFVQWQGDMWKLVETTHADDLPDGLIKDDDQMVEVYRIEPSDLFVGGEVENGPTEAFKGILESLNESWPTEDDVPEGETIAGAWTPKIEDISYFIVDVPFHRGSHGDDHYESGSYAEILEKFGVDPDSVESVAEETFE